VDHAHGDRQHVIFERLPGIGAPVEIVKAPSAAIEVVDSGKRRTLTAFQRSYEKSTGIRLASSAFYGRFSRGLVRLVRELVNETFTKLSERFGSRKRPTGPFKPWRATR
jgi:hypothetical protein